MLIDTHCHIDFHAYDPDRDEVIARARGAGVTRIIIPGIDRKTCQTALKLTEQFDGMIYSSVGVHPNSTDDSTLEAIPFLRDLAKSSARVVAIGEIGLDYYRTRSPKSTQLPAFEAQLALATELELPVIIHNRDASEDVMPILEQWVKTLPESLKNRPGVMHSFSGSAEIAERTLAAGFYLGFTGPITYKSADELRSIAATVPVDRMLVETDGPFLAPVPHRGNRNEPSYIPLILERLAALRLVSVEELGAATTANAERLFQL